MANPRYNIKDSKSLLEQHNDESRRLRDWYRENYLHGHLRECSTAYGPETRSYLLEDQYDQPSKGRIPPDLIKEKDMSYDPELYDRYGNLKSDQTRIDEAVLERIAKPRREAEIARRVALVGVVETLKDAENGTVVTFTRKSGKAETVYVMIKNEGGNWEIAREGRYDFDSLVQHLTTGSYPAENLKVATNFADLVAPTTTDAPATDA